MDRKEQPQQPSEFANERSVSNGDARVLGGGLGHDDDQGAEPGSVARDDIRKPVGATPRSAVTGRHDAGSGANETQDGLTASEEAIRRAAEDKTPGDEDADRPVFDQAEAPPRT